MLEANVIIRKNRKNRNLYFRIKVKGYALGEVSTGLYCDPKYWLGDRWCKVTGKLAQEDRTNNIRVNKELNQMIEAYREAWDKLNELGQSDITLNDLKLMTQGQHPKAMYKGKRLTLDEARDIYLERQIKPYIKNWHHAKNHMTTIFEYVKEETGNAEITIDQVTEQIAHNVYQRMCQKKFNYQNQVRHYAYKTRKLYIGRVVQFFDYFFKNKNRLDFVPVLPESNPFAGVEVIKLERENYSRINRETHFYTNSEVADLETVVLPSSTHNYVRNILLWQIYTGLSFGDIKHFNPKIHIETDMDGDKWLAQNRVKTDVQADIPLEAPALKLLEFFQGTEQPDFDEVACLINPGDMTTYRRYLVDIGGIVNLKLTETHKARHTFAVRMLDAGYAMEEVSRMMGHAHVFTTEKYYGFVTRNRVRQRRKIINNGRFNSPLGGDMKTGTSN